MAKNKQAASKSAAKSDRASVLIEPADDAAARRVRRQLRALGGTDMDELAPGFISAKVPTSEIEGLQRLARVNLLPRKQFRKA